MPGVAEHVMTERHPLEVPGVREHPLAVAVTGEDGRFSGLALSNLVQAYRQGGELHPAITQIIAQTEWSAAMSKDPDGPSQTWGEYGRMVASVIAWIDVDPREDLTGLDSEL